MKLYRFEFTATLHAEVEMEDDQYDEAFDYCYDDIRNNAAPYADWYLKNAREEEIEEDEWQ